MSPTRRSRRFLLLPIMLAAVCAAALILTLWWQVMQGKLALRRTISQQSKQDTLLQATLPDLVLSDDGSDTAALHMRRGDLLLLQGEFAAAQTEYQQAVDKSGGLSALRKLAQVQLQRRDLEAVTKTIDALKRAGARSEDLLLIQSVVLLQKAELSQAEQLLTPAPDSPQKHFGLALLAIIQGQHDKARQELKQVQDGWEPILRTQARTLQAAYDEYALFPDSPEIHRTTLLARALADVSQCELSLPMLAQVTAQKDDYRDAWIVQGFCELVTERPKEALASLERAYNLDPQKPEVQYFLARAYAAQQDHQNAVTFLQYALRNGFEPQRDARVLLGREAALEGNSPLALEQFDALTKLSDATLDDYRTYVKTSLSLASNDTAVAKAKEATDKWQDDAAAWELLGFANKGADKKDDAKKALQKALEIDPGRQSAKDMLEGI